MQGISVADTDPPSTIANKIGAFFRALFATTPKNVSAHQAAVAAAVLHAFVCPYQMRVIAFRAHVNVTGTVTDAVYKVRKVKKNDVVGNIIDVCSITFPHADPDGANRETADLSLTTAAGLFEKGDTCLIEVITAPTGATGLTLTADIDAVAG